MACSAAQPESPSALIGTRTSFMAMSLGSSLLSRRFPGFGFGQLSLAQQLAYDHHDQRPGDRRDEILVEEREMRFHIFVRREIADNHVPGDVPDQRGAYGDEHRKALHELHQHRA